MTSAEVFSLREQVGLDQRSFAHLLAVDLRTVTRWETGEAKPAGTVLCIMRGIAEKLRKDPGEAAATIAILRSAAPFGLAYLIVRLLDSVSR